MSCANVTSLSSPQGAKSSIKPWNLEKPWTLTGKGLRRCSLTGKGLRRCSLTGKGLWLCSLTGKGLWLCSLTGKGLRLCSLTGKGLRLCSLAGKGLRLCSLAGKGLRLCSLTGKGLRLCHSSCLTRKDLYLFYIIGGSDKSLATKACLCRQNTSFVVTKVCLPQIKKSLSWQNNATNIYRHKHVFVATKVN